MKLSRKKLAKKQWLRQRKEEEKERQCDEESKIEEAEENKQLSIVQAEREKSTIEEEAAAAAEALRVLKKKLKKERQAEKRKQLQEQKIAEQNRENVVEQTIPAMITVRRVAESNNNSPTVTITLKVSSPEEYRLFYTLVNGSDNSNKNGVNSKLSKSCKQKKKLKESNEKPEPLEKIPNFLTREFKVTVVLDVSSEQQNAEPSRRSENQDDLIMPKFCLPPGITIMKRDSSGAEKPIGTSLNTAKSQVNAIDNNKYAGKNSKKNKKKNDITCKTEQGSKSSTPSTDAKKITTLRNPAFNCFQQEYSKRSLHQDADNCGPAAIFNNENGMVTVINSSRLQQLHSNGEAINSVPLKTISNFAQKTPVTSTVFTDSQTQDTESDTISPFQVEKLLSGLPEIKITKVDRKTIKPEFKENKADQTAQITVIPGSGPDNYVKEGSVFGQSFLC